MRLRPSQEDSKLACSKQGKECCMMLGGADSRFGRLLLSVELLHCPKESVEHLRLQEQSRFMRYANDPEIRHQELITRRDHCMHDPKMLILLRSFFEATACYRDEQEDKHQERTISYR
jgi:hypothetical protein